MCRYVIRHLPLHASSLLTSYSFSHTWTFLAHKTKNLCHFNSRHRVSSSRGDNSKRWAASRQGAVHLLSERLACKQTKCALTAITSINLLLGVVSFSVELSNQRNLCQRENSSTRRFARKSWPLVNMLETVLLLPAFNQREVFCRKKKKKHKIWCQGFGKH